MLPGVLATVKTLELVDDDTFKRQLQVEHTRLNGSQQVDDSLFIFNIQYHFLDTNI
jgi:hypothetical protein